MISEVSDCETLSYRAVISQSGLGSFFRRTRNWPGMGGHGIEIDPVWVQQDSDSDSIPVESTKKESVINVTWATLLLLQSLTRKMVKYTVNQITG